MQKKVIIPHIEIVNLACVKVHLYGHVKLITDPSYL